MTSVASPARAFSKAAIVAKMRTAFAVKMLDHARNTDMIGMTLPIIKRGAKSFDLDRGNGQPWSLSLDQFDVLSETTFRTYRRHVVGNVINPREWCGTYQIVD